MATEDPGFRAHLDMLTTRVCTLEAQARTVAATLTEIQQALAKLAEPTVELHRDAGTGRFVTEEHAEENPDTTVRERR